MNARHHRLHVPRLLDVTRENPPSRMSQFGRAKRVSSGQVSQPIEPAAGVADPGRVFEEHRRFLWNLAYRLTGDGADAEDVVQETFVRALARPPADQERDWRPWLVRVALNLGRDLLRRRRRRRYQGTWLPSPIESGAPDEPVTRAADPARRYDLLESVSFAFLLALEALTPMQRAVLLLRDVFDYSVRETAKALDISETNARTTHMRARRVIRGYDTDRTPSRRERHDMAAAALERFLTFVSQGDVDAVESLLAADARALTDGGGEFHANTRPVVGAANVARLFVGLATRSESVVRVQRQVLNGQPAFVIQRVVCTGYAPKFVLLADVDDGGCLTCVYSVLASRKLAGVH